MFLEYRTLITALKNKGDTHFLKQFNEHNHLDNEIDKLEKDPVKSAALAADIETMKKRKLKLKDELYRYLQQQDAKH